MLLAGDIGGTKASLAVISPETGPRALLAEAILYSDGYPDLESLVRDFLSKVDWPVERACFGVAGPVINGRAQLTNLPWMIDENQLQEALGLESVHLLNDLQATAHALPFLEPSEFHTLSEGEMVVNGTRALIAPGTGLGEAFLVWDGKRYRACASEGGHAGFAPTNAIELELLRYLQERFEHVSFERVCSGLGIPNLFAFLKGQGAVEPEWLRRQLAESEDPTPVIITAALDQSPPCELCSATLDLFVSILAAEAGNLALKVLATGGVYLGGGIPPRILRALEDGRFVRAFRNKGRMSDLLARIPVRVVLNSNAALLGAANYGLEM